MSVYMLPVLARDDKPDRAWMNRVEPGQCSHALSARMGYSDSPDLVFTKFVHSVARASWVCFWMLATSIQIASSCATFLLRIAVVIATRAEKQVIRSAAGFYVAAVTNAQAIWYWSVGQFVGNAVSTSAESVLSSIEPAIAIRRSQSACPQPASVGFLDFGPEHVVDVRPRGVIAILRTIANGGRWAFFTAVFAMPNGCEVPASARTVASALSRRSAIFASLHFCVSMWASIIRLTSSAREMPSRLASRFKNCLCGSVNEIICLVTLSCLAFALVFQCLREQSSDYGRNPVVLGSRDRFELRRHVGRESYPALFRHELFAAWFQYRHTASIPQGIQA